MPSQRYARFLALDDEGLAAAISEAGSASHAPARQLAAEKHATWHSVPSATAAYWQPEQPPPGAILFLLALKDLLVDLAKSDPLQGSGAVVGADAEAQVSLADRPEFFSPIFTLEQWAAMSVVESALVAHPGGRTRTGFDAVEGVGRREG